MSYLIGFKMPEQNEYYQVVDKTFGKVLGRHKTMEAAKKTYQRYNWNGKRNIGIMLPIGVTE